MRTYLLIGGNLGNREQQLQIARQWIEQKVGQIVQRSSVYETAAWGITDQPDFLNQVILVETELSPIELLDAVQWIELEMGRVRLRHWGERIMDIDILFYDDQIIDEPRLQVPHPGIPDRNFVLAPLREIAPNFLHPIFQKTIETLSLACTDLLEVKKR
ncbi:MAG: 2-amino-4-hydroxy-6-hydroxymethyldihydropteridine diphosphokinase [Bacteroidota bacterium]